MSLIRRCRGCVIGGVSDSEDVILVVADDCQNVYASYDVTGECDNAAVKIIAKDECNNTAYRYVPVSPEVVACEG
jgi:hypothetical protein